MHTEPRLTRFLSMRSRRLLRSCSHLFGDGGDERGGPGRGDEGEGMPGRAGGVGGGAQRQPRCDAKQGSEKKGKRKEALEI